MLEKAFSLMVQLYLRAQSKLFILRKNDNKSVEEDDLLDQMDSIWEKLSKQDKAYIERIRRDLAGEVITKNDFVDMFLEDED